MLAASCRKKVVKGMAGHVLKAAQDEWAHLVLMCALSVVDDTALLSKVILAELRVSASALYWLVPMNITKADVCGLSWRLSENSTHWPSVAFVQACRSLAGSSYTC